MILNIEQVSNGLFSADFIINRGTSEVGKISVQGRLGSMEATIEGTFLDKRFNMYCIKPSLRKSKNIFRQYAISDSVSEKGTVYQISKKQGLFKGYGYRQMDYCGVSYEMFSLGMGEDGYKSPIYYQGRQTAQIDKDCVVYDQLHKYKIFAVDEHSANIAVMFCAYYFVSGVYTPGEKVTSSKSKYISVTKNKQLLRKYDPEFTKTIKV